MLLRDLLLNNLRRKIFALMLAVLVWMTIHFIEVRKQRSRAPATPALTNAPSSLP